MQGSAGWEMKGKRKRKRKRKEKKKTYLDPGDA
jgi:hypothetical protein